MTDLNIPTPGQFPFVDDLNEALARAIAAAELVDTLAAGQEATLAARDQAVAAAESVSAVAIVATGLDATGETNVRSALQALAKDAPPGSRIVVGPGTYLVQGTSSIGNVDAFGIRRSVRIEGAGPGLTRFVNDLEGGRALFEFVAPMSTPLAVSAVQSVDLPTDNSQFALTTKGVRLTVAAAPAWKRGQLVRLVADDAIAEDRPAVGGSVAREGQTFRVHSSTGTKIELQGALLGAFTTNVRVSAYDPTVGASLRGFSVDVPDARMGTQQAGAVATLRGLVAPIVEDVEVSRLSGPGLSIEGCYAYRVAGCRFGIAYDDPGASILGYGVNDKSSSFGRVVGCDFGAVRHAFTTNSSQIAAGSANVHQHGRTYFARVSGCTVSASTNAAFDTHHGAYGVTFEDVTALSSEVGVQIRGLHNVVRGVYAKDCRVAVRVYEESGGGFTRHTMVEGVRAVDCERIVEETHNPGTTTREATLTMYDGLRAYRATGPAYFQNATAQVRNLDHVAGPVVPDGSSAVSDTNSTVRLLGVTAVDFSAVTSGTGLRAFDFGSAVASTLEVWGQLIYRHGTAVTTLLNNATNTLLRVGGVWMSQAPATITAATPAAGSWIEHENAQNAGSSSGLSLSGGGVELADSLAPIGRTRERTIALDVNATTANRTLGTLPRALRRGTRLTLTNVGTANNVTIAAVAGLVALAGGASSIALTPGQSVDFLAVGSGGTPEWRQRGAVL